MEIPKGCAGLIYARSGLACKKGICLSNGIGVIDSDYRGEISVGLFNSSKDEFTVERGERIAQLMFVPVESAVFVSTDSLDETERGEGGFGSTGTK
jgi:dUTP pyrophosphatase